MKHKATSMETFVRICLAPINVLSTLQKIVQPCRHPSNPSICPCIQTKKTCIHHAWVCPRICQPPPKQIHEHHLTNMYRHWKQGGPETPILLMILTAEPSPSGFLGTWGLLRKNLDQICFRDRVWYWYILIYIHLNNYSICIIMTYTWLPRVKVTEKDPSAVLRCLQMPLIGFSAENRTERGSLTFVSQKHLEKSGSWTLSASFYSSSTFGYSLHHFTSFGCEHQYPCTPTTLVISIRQLWKPLSAKETVVPNATWTQNKPVIMGRLCFWMFWDSFLSDSDNQFFQGYVDHQQFSFQLRKLLEEKVGKSF